MLTLPASLAPRCPHSAKPANSSRETVLRSDEELCGLVPSPHTHAARTDSMGVTDGDSKLALTRSESQIAYCRAPCLAPASAICSHGPQSAASATRSSAGSCSQSRRRKRRRRSSGSESRARKPRTVARPSSEVRRSESSPTAFARAADHVRAPLQDGPARSKTPRSGSASRRSSRTRARARPRSPSTRSRATSASTSARLRHCSRPRRNQPRASLRPQRPSCSSPPRPESRPVSSPRRSATTSRRSWAERAGPTSCRGGVPSLSSARLPGGRGDVATARSPLSARTTRSRVSDRTSASLWCVANFRCSQQLLRFLCFLTARRRTSA